MRPHGIRGEVAVRSLTDNPARFQPGSRLLVGVEPEVAVEMTVLAARPQQPDRLLVSFEGIPDRTGAEGLRGCRIFAPGGDLPPLGEDAFWERDLIGLVVVDLVGRELGTISGVLGRAEQDLWQVETPAGPVLLPATRAIVVAVDLAGRKVTVDPPAGLFAEIP